MEYKVEKCVIAFIDVLGSSDAIYTDTEKSLNDVHASYDNALSIFELLFNDHKLKPAVKIFSDNIVVSVSYENNQYIRSAFLAVAMLSAIIQVEFLKMGWLTRGGISFGKYFVDEVMTWGEALVKAYKLESNVAIYPRVVVDPELIGELNLAIPPNSHCTEWIRQDIDGLFFVDYINPFLKYAEVFTIKLFDIVDKKVMENTRSVKVCQKWIWLSNYLNQRLSELGDSKKMSQN